jgi:hypothetical protein
MTKSEIRINDEFPNDEAFGKMCSFGILNSIIRHLVIDSDFGLRVSDFQ